MRVKEERLSFTEHVFYARHRTKHLKYTNSLILFTTRGGTEAKEKSANECVIKDRKTSPSSPRIMTDVVAIAELCEPGKCVVTEHLRATRSVF